MSRIISHLPHGSNHNTPEIIVVHAMGEFIKDSKGQYHAVEYLNNIGLSLHSAIAPDGSNFRCREDHEGAYHAKGFNSNSLGIEFLVPGIHDYGSFLEAIKKPYVTDKAYREGLEQVKEWMDLHNIKQISRHSDLSPERKVDPGTGFPWLDFLDDLGR